MMYEFMFVVGILLLSNNLLLNRQKFYLKNVNHTPYTIIYFYYICPTFNFVEPSEELDFIEVYCIRVSNILPHL